MATGTIGSDEGAATGYGGEPDSRRILAGLFRRAPLIVACTLLTAGAALVFSLLQTKQYTADASLLFRNPGFDQRLSGSSSPNVDPTREAATNISLVSLGAVADRTAAALGGGLTGGEISSKVSVQSEGQSDVVSVQATDHNPQVAATIANAFAESYIVFRRDADRRKVQQAVNLVKADFARLSPAAQQSVEGQSLQKQISQLSTLEALQTGNAELVQRATPPGSPSSPKTARNTILGLTLGLLLGIGVALLLERLDRRLRQPKDFEEALGLPVLTVVPESKVLARSVDGMGELSTSDAFQMLRARLRYFNVDRDINSVLVDLRRAWRRKDDGRLEPRRRRRQRRPANDPRRGRPASTDHRPTRGNSAPTGPVRAAQRAELGGGDRTAGRGGGPTERQGGDPAFGPDRCRLSSPQPGRAAGKRGDDATRRGARRRLRPGGDRLAPPPVLADAIPLTKMVNGVIVVGQVNKTTREQAQALHAQLQSLKAPVLGMVVNRMPRRGSGYYTYYGYGRRSPSKAA